MMKNKLKKVKIVMVLKKGFDWVLLVFKFLWGKLFLLFHPLNINIMSIDETIADIKKNKKSLIRFGDGEFLYMNNKPLSFQKVNDELIQDLKNILNNRYDKLLLCVPEPIQTRKNVILKSKLHWTYRLAKDYDIYSSLDKNYLYGNTFVSRPYIVYKDKSNAGRQFKLLKELWQDKKVLIVEGRYSCSGVGNDLFANTKKIGRIICPSTQAYDVYPKLRKELLKVAKDWDLVLIALGPTSKLLVRDLLKKNIWAIDIGHIDTEYEWFLANAKKRFMINNKHTADANLKDEHLVECDDQGYLKSIITRIE